MKEFADFYVNNDKEYSFTIKIAGNELNISELKSDISNCLEQYKIDSISSVTKTIIQKHPLDFPSINNAEVYITDVVMKYPVTSSALRTIISKYLELSEMNIVIYSENDPRVGYTDHLNANKDGSFKKSYKVFLGGDEDWGEESAYGEDQITPFLKELQDKVNNRKTAIVTNNLILDALTNSETFAGDEKSKGNNTSVLGTNSKGYRND